MNIKKEMASTSIIYIYVFNYLLKKVHKQIDVKLNISYLLEAWHRNVYHVPRMYDTHMIQDFIDSNLIEKIQGKNYIIKCFLAENIKERLVLGAAKPFKNNIPFIHLFIFSKMIEKYGQKNQYISQIDAIRIWRTYIPNFPRVFDQIILQEMCNFKLLRRVNSQRYVLYGAQSQSKLNQLKNKYLY